MVATVVPDTPPDPYETVRRPLRRLQWASALIILLALALSAGSLWVVVHSGLKSMTAFEELPVYRINILRQAYRLAVTDFDQSNANTLNQIRGEATANHLARGRSLSEMVLLAEQDFATAIELYGQTMDVSARQVGGTQEWRNNLSLQLQQLKSRSEARQAALQTFVERHPSVNHPPEGASSSPQSGQP